MGGVPDAVRAAITASREPSRAAVARWHASPAYRTLDASFADCPPEAEAVAERAARLLVDGPWLAPLLEPLVRALADDPFFEPPFKVNRDALRIGAALYDAPLVSLTASVTDAAALASRPPPGTIVFSGRLAVTRVVKAGGARWRRWSAEASAPCFVEMAGIELEPGCVRRVDGRREAELVEGAESDVVTLVATVRPGADPLMREYDIATGRLSRVASADDRPSRAEMLLTFLRLSGRADAGSCFEEATRDSAFQLRWAAMREWLALDLAAALPRLAQMAAADPHAEVRAAAILTLGTAERRLAEARCRG